MIAALLSPLALRAIATVAVMATLVGVFLYFKDHYFNQGYASAISAIAAQDRRAIDAKDEAIAKVRACRAAGGTWNVADGVCG